MANVLTDLAADIYAAADVVSRELVGMIPSSTINGNGADRAAIGDTVRSHVTAAATAVTNTESMTIPQGTDQTVSNKTMTLSKNKGVQIPWTGENILSVNNGSGFETIYGDQIAQAMRTLTNEMEADLWLATKLAASRAFGTAGTTPFASSLTDSAQVLKILLDNGSPNSDCSLVMDTTAGANLRTLTQLTKANENGSDAILRQGVLMDVHGFSLRESAKVTTHAVGTDNGAYLASAAFSVGDTALTVDTGAGTILAGDVITFAGDTNKYVVATALAAGTVVIAEPGLREALADNAALSSGASYTGNVAFERSAVELAVRAPAMPNGGDLATDSMIVVDPRSGIPFEIRMYKGFQKSMMNISAVWGVKAWKSENIAISLG